MVALASAGEVNIDYVVLQPGEWGRFAGLNVRKQTVDIMQRMGISAIRCGGSFASVTAWPDGGGGTPPSNVSGEWYQWQKWTGPVWERPSIGAVWNAYSGNSYSLIGGWGAILWLLFLLSDTADPHPKSVTLLYFISHVSVASATTAFMR